MMPPPPPPSWGRAANNRLACGQEEAIGRTPRFLLSQCGWQLAGADVQPWLRPARLSHGYCGGRQPPWWLPLGREDASGTKPGPGFGAVSQLPEPGWASFLPQELGGCLLCAEWALRGIHTASSGLGSSVPSRSGVKARKGEGRGLGLT